MEPLMVKQIVDDLTLLKSSIYNLCFVLNNSKIKSEVIRQSFTNIELIEDLSIPYSNFYYDDEDECGNKVNTYYGYICCQRQEIIIKHVSLVNKLKVKVSDSIKSLRYFYKSNPPKFNKIMASIDPDGRINFKELIRNIVIIDSNNSPINKISFQQEIINKGKGRCLTGSEISFVINNYFEGVDGKYSKDLQILKKIKSNELLSPIGAERRKCRVNIRSEVDTFKGQYCSIPVIVLSSPSEKFRTNLHTIFEKSFKKTRVDQQLEDMPLLAFRSFTRKKIGFKTFLSIEELVERENYLKTAFI